MEIPSKRRKSRGGGGSSGGAIVPASAVPVSSSMSSIVPLRLRKPQEYLYGRLSVAEFVQKLSALGITDARVEQDEENCSSGCVMIHLVSLNVLDMLTILPSAACFRSPTYVVMSLFNSIFISG